MIKINEIFYSIQGESSFTGWPTVFIRTSGCHLRCNYCDTTYAYYQGKKMSVSEIIENVEKYECKRVCVTGGEPLLQKEVFPLMQQLCDQGYTVSLETSGDKDCGPVDPRVLKVIDVKTPDSGEGDTFNLENLKYANVNTEFKFVITSKKDFDWSVDFAIKHHLFSRSIVYFSPSFNSISPRWLAEEIMKKKLPLRLQLQMHKYIWDAETRGV